MVDIAVLVSEDTEVDALANDDETPDVVFVDLGGGIIEFDKDVLPLALLTSTYFFSLTL